MYNYNNAFFAGVSKMPIIYLSSVFIDSFIFFCFIGGADIVRIVFLLP